MQTITIGKLGESEALAYLTSKGYHVISTNYRNYYGEIDIICFDKTTLVFVEVKKRSSAKFGLPRESVTLSKQNRIRTTAEIFLQYFHAAFTSCRFDVIEILNDQITHIPNAF